MKEGIHRFPPPPPSLGPFGAAPFGKLPLLLFCALATTSAFLAFFSSFVFLILSLISRSAASRAASRTSGFSARFFCMTSKVAPTMDLEYGFLVVRRLFLIVSAATSFLCCFLYIAVQVSFEGFSLLWKYLLHLEFAKRKTWESERINLIPLPGYIFAPLKRQSSVLRTMAAAGFCYLIMMADMIYRTLLVLSLALVGVSADTTGTNATSILEGAGGYFSNLAESELAGYSNWLADRGSSIYSRHLFLPTVTDTENGAAIFWKFLAVDDGGSVAVGRSGSDIKATHIQFAIAVRATGWVSLGISAAGGMLGSDVAMYETANPTQVVDGYVIEERFPMVDDCQHWTLVGAHNDTSDGWLIVELSRPLDTEDTQDHAIVDDADLFTPTRLIAAWGDTPEVSYHGTNVGKSTVKLFGEQESKDFDLVLEKRLDEASDGYFDVRENNYTIPANETTYHYVCKTYAELKDEFNLPDTENDVLTFIGGGAVLTPETEPYVHHFIVSGSSSSDNCTDANTMLYGWAPGDDYMAMPKNVGIPLFRQEGQFRSISIQIHYNNPTLKQGLLDSSGMRLYYTVTPREVEAAWLIVADSLDMQIGVDIPDGLTQYTFSCGGDCSSAVLAVDEPVTVIAETLHMHQTGVRMTNEVIRDGEVVNKGVIDVFEFSQQGSYLVQQKEFQIQSGDSIRTTCYYRDGSNFGLGSQEEMCVAFYLYYPAKQLDFGAFGTFPWMCVYGIDELPVCKEELEFKSLSSEEELGRVFGTSPGSCSALGGDVGGTGGGNEQGGSDGGGSTDAPSPSTVSSASTFVIALPLIVVAAVVNACIGI